MSKIVVLGAGISGHTAAAFLKKKLGKKHEVIVVSPNTYYQWFPSNIWVGIGRMTIDQVRFKLNKVYDRWNIIYKQAKAVSIHPEGDPENKQAFITIEYVGEEIKNEPEKVFYDFLINATGPKLNFEATPGLGPGNHTTSVLFAPNGFMKVDADYSGKPFEEWNVADWPEIYQNQSFTNIFATGIAFAPPHSISKPMKSS